MLHCSYCDSQYSKWQGQCDTCGKWGTIAQEQEDQVDTAISVTRMDTTKQVVHGTTHIAELDMVLGGGIVPGSLTLLSGEPGIGKSTLVLQIIVGYTQEKQGPVVYMCGEESPAQVRMRMTRLGIATEHILFISDTRTTALAQVIEKEKPVFVVVDSIQTMYDTDASGEAGSVSAVRGSTGKILALAKTHEVPIMVIGHVTKDGAIAGPRMLEHMVDVVLYVEGDRAHDYRLVRSTKNRFGPTDQVGVFHMTEKGLIEVANPSQLFLSQQLKGVAGSVVTVLLEGQRPFLIEIQALTNKTAYGYPKRTASGYSSSRLELLLAILSRRAGLQLAEQDVYINVVGGLKVSDPALDAAAALAIASSLANQSVPEGMVVLGELGLGGEVRPVGHVEKRLNEVSRLGFSQVAIPSHTKVKKSTLDITHLDTIQDLMSIIGVRK